MFNNIWHETVKRLIINHSYHLETDGTLALVNEYFDWCKPGLSAYANEPIRVSEH